MRQRVATGSGMVGGLPVYALFGALETTVFQQDPRKEPGSFGNPVPWFDDDSVERRARDLNNGRIACSPPSARSRPARIR